MLLQSVAYASEDYKFYGSQQLSLGNISKLEAILLNLGEYGLEFLPIDMESAFSDAAIKGISKSNPKGGNLLDIVTNLITASKGLVNAYSDYMTAISSLHKALRDQLNAEVMLAQGLMDGQIELMAVAYEIGTRHRNTNIETPLDNLAGTDSLIESHSKKLDDIIVRIDKKINSKFRYTGNKYVKDSYKNLKNNIINYNAAMKAYRAEYPSVLYMYTLGRYPSANEENTHKTDTTVKTGTIVNCNTYYAGLNKELTGGRAFSINAGSLVYIEGSDYSSDGYLMYYVRTESNQYGWISTNFLKVN